MPAFPNLAATALAALHVPGETLEYRAVSTAIDSGGFVTSTPGAWTAVPRPYVVSHQPDDRRESAPDGDRYWGSLLVCLGTTGPGPGAPPYGRGDEIRFESRIWVIDEVRDYGGRSAHRELVCGLRDA